MGDIADMMLDGTLDCVTGEYLGDSVGYPRTIEKQIKINKKQKEKCPICGKLCAGKFGLEQHTRDKHKKEVI